MYPELKRYEKINKIQNLQVANFGTGFGYYDFQYSGLNVNAFNFSLLQQTLEFDYKIMKYYQDKFAKGCKMCLVLPFFIFCADYLPDIEQINERYYSILPKDQVQSSCCTSFEAYTAARKKDMCNEREPELTRPLTLAEMEKQTREALENWKRKLKIYSFQSGILSADVKKSMIKTKEWLRKILLFCWEKELEPIVIVPPMSQTLLEAVSKEFRETHYYQVLMEVVDKNTAILDYSKDTKFCQPELYGWPGFLVRDEAKSFTRDVLSQIHVI